MTRTGKLKSWLRQLQRATSLILLPTGIILNAPLTSGADSPGVNVSTSGPAAPTNDYHAEMLGAWIWDAKTFDGQTCQFWRAFDVPTATNKVSGARLLLTADNEFTVFFDGREIGHGAEWRELFEYDLTSLMSPGRHVLAVTAFNPTGFAGMLLGLRIDLAAGPPLEIKSDDTWKIVPNEVKSWKELPQAPVNWPAARIVGTIGTSPWWTTPARVSPGNNVPSPDHPVKESDPLALLGSWIWDANLFDGQTCQFWRAFDVPTAANKVAGARLLLTADNEFTVYLDGREIGHGAEWRELFDYDLTLLMSPGRHVLAVKALNPSGFAGMLLGLRIDLATGPPLEIKSDETWRIAPNEAKNWKEVSQPSARWPAARIVGTVGAAPWWITPVRINPMQTPAPIKLNFWQTAWFQVPFFTACGLMALTIVSLVAQLALHQKEHWLLQRERARIAMDVHDDIGSRMTHLVLNGEVVHNELPAESRARAQLEQICDEARGVLSSIDEILWALNPRRDTLQDFADYVCDYAQKFLGPANIECVFDIELDSWNAAADLPLRRSLLLAIKETLNNTVKYSGATEVWLNIGRQKHDLVVIVQDNGRGFDPKTIRPGRSGLGNMSRRMRELGGHCKIASKPGNGCRIEFRIPLKSPRRLSLSWMWQRKPPATSASEAPNLNSNQKTNLK